MKAGLLLCLAVAWPSAVAGQAMVATSAQPIGNSDPKDMRLRRESDEMLRTMIHCVVARAAGQGRSLLATTPGSKEEDRIFGSLRSRLDWCMPGRAHNALASPWQVLRGAIAEELWKVDHAGRMQEVRLSPEELIAWERTYPVGTKGDQQRMLVEQSARCVTARDPRNTASVLSAPPLSSAEASAVDALKPVLAQCLNKGVKARFSYQILRSVLAEGAYEYAGVARAGLTLAASDRAGKE